MIDAASPPPNPNPNPPSEEEDVEIEHHAIVIVGGGIGGLILALYLDAVYNHRPRPADSDPKQDKHDDVDIVPPPSLSIHVYESASSYNSNAGGAIGLYPNGLRVLRDLSARHPSLTSLLRDVRLAGCDYVFRRWMRHDGREVCVAREDELLSSSFDVGVVTGGDDARLLGRGIPRGGILGGAIGAMTNLVGRGRRTTTADSGGNGNDVAAVVDDDATASDLRSMGIRRYRYQDILHDACRGVGIAIHFGKRVVGVSSTIVDGADDDVGSVVGDGGDMTRPRGPRTLIEFKDGSKVSCSLLIGADGINSRVREYVINPIVSRRTVPASSDDDDGGGGGGGKRESYVPEYTGVTCLMGCARVPFVRGICFPSSVTTRCHACYYIARRGGRDDGKPNDVDDDENDDGNNHQPRLEEVVFQIYFPSPIERPDQWRTLTLDEARDECRMLADRLRTDGWDEMFLAPLESSTLSGVLRVGIRNRVALDSWHVGGGRGDGDVAGERGNAAMGSKSENVGPAVLLGDAAHPPVPYIGQGAMMATEDAGTLAMVLREYCPPLVPRATTFPKGDVVELDLSKFSEAMRIYESLRVDRVRGVLASSVALGKTQQRRAESKLYNAWREMSIKAQVWAHGTLPIMRLGASYDYRARAEEALAMARVRRHEG